MKYRFGVVLLIISLILVSGGSVWAAEVVKAVIESREVSYDNKESHGSYQDVQESIDELYRRSGILDKEWKDPILNAADPVLGEDMVPVTIDDDGTVHYANLYTKWYEYETKKWANAVILTAEGKNKNYKTGDTIKEDDIESYFVWIPRYKYKIWDLGNYTGTYVLSQIQDTEAAAESSSTALRRIASSTRLIDIVFQKKEEKTTNKEGECAPDPSSGGGSNCHVGNYMTHPAFTLGNTELNGIWVGKFEVTGDANKVTVKPGITSWRGQNVGTFWNSLFNYQRQLDSHMMKNIEWGAAAYLSHSTYGIGKEININNNSLFLTGYSSTTSIDNTSIPAEYGTNTDVNQPYNTPTGYLASTTGNITGIYDMSGGADEVMAAYMDNYGEITSNNVHSGLTIDTLSKYNQYFDKYSVNSILASYDKRILGDATGEMGPFYYYRDKDKSFRIHNGWYADNSNFIHSSAPWFMRGGEDYYGVLAGQFCFVVLDGEGLYFDGSRLVLAVK